MPLYDEIKTLSGNKRRFFLLRVVDMDKQTALNICGVKQGTYNTWLQNREFVDLYRRRDEFAGEYKQEAIRLLRRDNQLAAVLLEAKIVDKMAVEIETGEYVLIRTNLAKEVYSKLMSDLDYQPQVQNLTWEQRIAMLVDRRTIQLPEGATDAIIEADSVQENQHQESNLITESEQTTGETEKETKES